MCAQVYTYAHLCSGKNVNKQDNSLLDLFGIFLAKSYKMARISTNQQASRVNFDLPNSCVNILYHIVSLKF